MYTYYGLIGAKKKPFGEYQKRKTTNSIRFT
jgi:hypothetical protein